MHDLPQPSPQPDPIGDPSIDPSVDRRNEQRAGNSVAFLSSLVFHVSLLIVLACWGYSAGKPSQGLLLNADIGESESVALDLVQTYDIAPQLEQTPQPQSSPELSLDVKFDKQIELLTDEPKSLPSPALSAVLASMTTEQVSENLNQQGRGRGASFFGSYAHGDRFVYVLDSSRSMQGVRWTYACNQLIDSLNSLKPGQEFFVICFDMQTSYLFNAKPERIKFSTMDSKNKIARGVRSWLSTRTLGRATMPAEALQVALQLNPDAIFLLSDGELQDDSLFMLRNINRVGGASRQIPIHTIHLFSLEGRFTLQQIAMENGGSFTPVEGR